MDYCMPRSKKRLIHKLFTLNSARTLTDGNSDSKSQAQFPYVKMLLASEPLSPLRRADGEVRVFIKNDLHTYLTTQYKFDIFIKNFNLFSALKCWRANCVLGRSQGSECSLTQEAVLRAKHSQFLLAISTYHYFTDPNSLNMRCDRSYDDVERSFSQS